MDARQKKDDESEGQLNMLFGGTRRRSGGAETTLLARADQGGPYART